MADISFMGATYQGVPAVNLPNTDGGLSTFYEWNFLGKNAELMGEIFSDQMTLAETQWADWTPSASAYTILKSESLEPFQADLSKYEYAFKWETSIYVALKEGASKKAQLIYEGADQYQWIIKRPGDIGDIEAERFDTNTSISFYTVPLTYYYNKSGTKNIGYLISYGIYPALVTQGTSNSYTDTLTITPKTPNIQARTNNSYFSVTSANEVDAENTIIKRSCELYRIEAPGTMREMYRYFFERYNQE